MTAMPGWPGQVTGQWFDAGRPVVWGVLLSSASEFVGELVRPMPSRDEADRWASEVARNQPGILTAACWSPAADPEAWTVLVSRLTPREHLQRLEATGRW